MLVAGVAEQPQKNEPPRLCSRRLVSIVIVLKNGFLHLCRAICVCEPIDVSPGSHVQPGQTRERLTWLHAVVPANLFKTQSRSFREKLWSRAIPKVRTGWLNLAHVGQTDHVVRLRHSDSLRRLTLS